MIPRLPLTLCFGLLALCAPPAQATFSIAAVDPVTGQVGSAGASCIAGSIILSDVHPGVGIIHTQSYWNSQNQQYARSLMEQGYAPQAIIDSLVANDAQNNPTIRQYGITDLVDGGRSAAYTGISCHDYKNHILGPTFAIAGNILLGQEILDAMEEAFLNAPGSLADKLMAALQGAKVPGADTRCLNYGKSSISAFLRVAQPFDEEELYLDLNVNNTAPAVDPIDLLQDLYDNWVAGIPGAEQPAAGVATPVLGSVRPNPFSSETLIRYSLPQRESVELAIFDLTGRLVAVLLRAEEQAGEHQLSWRGPIDHRGSGIYVCRLRTGAAVRTQKLFYLGG